MSLNRDKNSTRYIESMTTILTKSQQWRNCCNSSNICKNAKTYSLLMWVKLESKLFSNLLVRKSLWPGGSWELAPWAEPVPGMPFPIFPPSLLMFLRSVNKKCAFPFKEPPPFAQRRGERRPRGTAAEEEKKPSSGRFQVPPVETVPDLWPMLEM